MKRRLLLLFALFSLIVLCSCSAKPVLEELSDFNDQKASDSEQKEENLQEISIRKASYSKTYNSLEEIEEAADLVVKVTVTGEKSEIRDNQPNIKEGIFPIGYVLTSVYIDEIYKNDGKTKEGDIVKIEEYYTTALNPDNSKVTNVYSSGFYLPMVEGHQYILFLKAPQNAGDYEIVRFDLGKYAVISDLSREKNVYELSPSELEIAVQTDSKQNNVPSEYFAIAEQIKNTYR